MFIVTDLVSLNAHTDLFSGERHQRIGLSLYNLFPYFRMFHIPLTFFIFWSFREYKPLAKSVISLDSVLVVQNETETVFPNFVGYPHF